MNESQKKCPFSNSECNDSCGLYIDSNELNELLLNRLKSLGILNKDSGTCSLKTLAMSNARKIFETTTTRRY